ncbi:high mobility group B protein 11 [Dorcoceras hygrometricum]|uniref:High mobility group B protein 11 n=1 Tax=Dorcoceras hygrometricum TaxID=472368 RepID=A0A2Z7C515_9LAMI|nr:high mobility group B protein 11 [Dorcoceras hygrometricum]
MVSAIMMSACLLEEAMSSKDDVSNISRQLSGNSNDDVRKVADEDRTVMMTSAVMSSQSAVEQKQFQQLTREAQEMERRRLTLHSISAVALNRRRIQLLQAFNCWGAINAQDGKNQWLRLSRAALFLMFKNQRYCTSPPISSAKFFNLYNSSAV